ncbi:MAG: hypothetical protein GQ524_05535 [Anaerolineales bacterium]|nr:hypothetical protein [Anaerolineales bacterium]
MEKKRPIGVTLLAILAGFAAGVAIIYTLQMLHLWPVTGPLGQYNFFTFNMFGAILWGIMAAIWLWVARLLWAVDIQGWLFVVVLATLNIILGLFWIIGGTPWEAISVTLFLNTLILIYGLLPGTKAAFGVDEMQG